MHGAFAFFFSSAGNMRLIYRTRTRSYFIPHDIKTSTAGCSRRDRCASGKGLKGFEVGQVKIYNAPVQCMGINSSVSPG